MKRLLSIFALLVFASCSVEPDITDNGNDVKEKLEVPTFSVASGTFTTNIVVDIVAPNGASVRYTTDGSNPKTSGTAVVGNTVNVTHSMTITAYSFKSGYEDSDVVSNDYEITGTIASPVCTPSSGTFYTNITVTMSTMTSNATINWTTNGVDWQTGNSVIVHQNTTLVAYASRTGWSDSLPVTNEYVITGYVNDPVFDVSGGTYSTNITVNLSTTTSGATIKYTTDGTDPRSSGTAVVGNTVSVDYSMTIRAYAYKSDWGDSGVVEQTYTITGTLATPTFSVTSGTYNTNFMVNLVCSTTNAASIHWSTNSGSTWVNGDSFDVTYSVTALAYATLSGWDNSITNNINYVMKVESPSIITTPVTNSTNITVSISANTAGSSVEWSTNGSTWYVGSSVSFNRNSTVYTRGVKSGWTDSDVVQQNYYFKPVEPSISVVGGTYITNITVDMSTTTAGADVHWSTNGGANWTTGTTVTINNNVTLLSYATKIGWLSSTTNSETYQITGTVAEPTFSVSGGTYNTNLTVTLNTATSGATIKYTTDGTDPKSSGTAVVGNTVNVNQSMTVRAYAYKADWADSSVVQQTYTLKVPNLVSFSVAGGTYITNVFVDLNHGSDGVSIKYTTNGDDPATSGIVGSNVTVNFDMTVKACATKAGWESSDVSSETYDVPRIYLGGQSTNGFGTWVPAVFLSHERIMWLDIENYRITGIDMYTNTLFWAYNGSDVKFDANGTMWRTTGNITSNNTTYWTVENNPTRLAFDESGNVYSAGYWWDGGSIFRPCYYSNGVQIAMDYTNVGHMADNVSDIFVTNGVVYVVGRLNLNAVMWTNGVRVDIETNAWATSIYVDGNDIYIGGTCNDTGGDAYACYWKNGVRTVVGPYKSQVNMLQVFDGRLYVAGQYERSYKGFYWVDGNFIDLWEWRCNVKDMVILD